MSKTKSFIIKSGASSEEWFTKRSEIYLAAEQDGILSYLEPGSSLPTISNIESKAVSEYNIYKNMLLIQTEKDEKNLIPIISDLVKDYSPYIYELNQIPVVGRKKKDYRDCRKAVYVPWNGFKDYISKLRMKIPTDLVEKEELALRVLKDNYFTTVKGTPEERELSRTTKYIPTPTFYSIIEKEVLRDPRIVRYKRKDANKVDQVIEKLTATSLAEARFKIESQSVHLAKTIKRTNDEHAKVLTFLMSSIEGVVNSVASEAIRKQQWERVIPSLNEMYTEQLTQSSSTSFLLKLLHIKLNDNESIQHYMEKAKNIVSNIQEINQVLNEKSGAGIKKWDKLNPTQCESLLLLTEQEFNQQYPLSRQYTSEQIILDSLIMGCSHQGCRLATAMERFKLKRNEETQTVVKFFAAIRIEENILPQEKQVRLNEYVEVNYVSTDVKDKNEKKRKKDKTSKSDSEFCSFHSHGNNISNHTTANCRVINEGHTKTDPNNSKWQVRIKDGLHFVPFVKNGKTDQTNKKRKKGNGKGHCSTCLEASKKDKSITTEQINSHDTSRHNPNFKSKVKSDDPASTNASHASTEPILDSGTNAFIFPINYPNLSNIQKVNSNAETAKKGTTLKLDSIANYGILNVKVADVNRPLISEGLLQSSPYELTIYKAKSRAWIFDPNKSSHEKGWLVLSATLNENDKLYHIDDLSKLLCFKTSSTITESNYTIKAYEQSNKRTKHYKLKSTHGSLNLLEVLHVCLGHISEQHIKYIVKHNIVTGLNITYDQIKHLHLGLCDTCMISRMKSFPIYRSTSQKVYGIFELLSFDIVEFGNICKSINGYVYAFIYVDSVTDTLFVYGGPDKTYILESLQKCIHNNGPSKNPKSLKLNFLNTDTDRSVLDDKFLTFCSENDIYLQLSSPYKHQHNLIEAYIESIKNGVRSALLYNQAPKSLWFHALEYYVYTYNHLSKMGDKKSRIEKFTGIKSDMSTAVPFYSKGFYNVSKEEKINKTFSNNAVPCHMIGYANKVSGKDTKLIKSSNKLTEISYKDSYLVLPISNIPILVQTPLTRHDCYFEMYQLQSSLLNINKDTRDPNVSLHDPNYKTSLNETFGYPKSDFEIMSQGNNDNSNEEQILSDSIRKSSRISKPNRLYSTYTKVPNITEINKRLDELIKDTNETTPILSTSNTSSESNPPEFRQPKNLIMPLTLLEAISGPDCQQWYAAFIDEIIKTTGRKTWDICNPKDSEAYQTAAIGSKFHFKLSQNTDGSWKYKVRLVAKGYTQVYGKDYEDTFAPTAKFKSICIILNLAAIFNWVIEGCDIENAFLESYLSEDIYMNLPTDVFQHLGEHGFLDHTPITVKLRKSLYGLKQAGEVFYQYLKQILLDAKFVRTINDICVFVWKDSETGHIVIVLLWVDDILITGNCQSKIDELKEFITNRVTKLKILGELKRFIGLDVARDRIGYKLELTQKAYTKGIVNSKQPPLKSAKVPLSPYLDYRKKGDHTKEPLHKDIGKLRYLADRTKPKLLASLSLLATGAANPTQEHIDGVKHCIRYLVGDISDGLSFASASDPEHELELFAMCDASYIPGYDSKSQLGYALFLNLNSGTVCARSYKDSTVSRSAAEPEIKAIDATIVEVLWFRSMLTELGFPPLHPTVIWTDTESGITLSETFKLSHKSQHMAMRLNFIHQEILNQTIRLCYIDTANNVADVLTKALPFIPFTLHADKLQHGFTNKPIQAKSRKVVKTITKKAKFKRILNSKKRTKAQTSI